MYKARWIRLAVTVAGTLCLLGSSPPAPPASSPAPAGIELSTIGVPGGWMGANTGRLKETIELKGAEAAECGGEASCLRITYRSNLGWAGVYWWPTACEKHEDRWEAATSGKCAIDLRKGPDARPIERLTFSARGTKGREKITFGVGGDNLQPKKREVRIGLEPTWQSYEIDLKGVDLKRAAGLFFWTASELDNPSGFTIYLKDIQFTSTR